MKFDKIKQQEKVIIDTEKKIRETVQQGRETLFERFPLPFTLAGAFGLVATFYGFEKIIDKIDFFANNPWILLGVGLITLSLTGSFYNKLR